MAPKTKATAVDAVKTSKKETKPKVKKEVSVTDKPKKKTAPVVEKEEEISVEEVPAKEKKPRVAIDPLAVVDELIAKLSTELARVKEEKIKSTEAIKLLREVARKLPVLKTHLCKNGNKKNRVKKINVNSGLLKPVKISPAMLAFAGWSADEPKSRVDVTKFVCDYIKKNGLQNPENRRQIIPDAKLAKILGYTPSDGPMTYPGLQKHFKAHFLG